MHVIFNKLEKQKKSCCHFVNFVVNDNLISDNPKLVNKLMVDHNTSLLAQPVYKYARLEVRDIMADGVVFIA